MLRLERLLELCVEGADRRQVEVAGDVDDGDAVSRSVDSVSSDSDMDPIVVTVPARATPRFSKERSSRDATVS